MFAIFMAPRAFYIVAKMNASSSMFQLCASHRPPGNLPGDLEATGQRTRLVDRLRSWAWVGSVVLGIGSCFQAQARPLQRFAYAELHMATLFRVVFFAPDQLAADRAAEAVFRRVAELEDRMTDYDPRSELMQLCQRPAGEPVPVSDDLFRVLAQAQRMAKKTEGAFDITAGPYIQLWRKARKNRLLPTPVEIADAARRVGWEKIRLSSRARTVTLAVNGMRLDLGGIAKGFAADEALALLRRTGIRRAMVAASGDIALGNPPPKRRGWGIGIASIDHPLHGFTDEVWLHNMGVSTSGDTEQYVEIDGQRYSHIVNPKTGLGLTERIGVTILAPSGTLSDSLATAVSVMGEKKGLALIDSWRKVAGLIVVLRGEGKQVLRSSRYPHPSNSGLESRD